MAQPTRTQVHVDRPLTNVSVAYIQESEWGWKTASPIVPSEKQSDLYFTYTKDDFMRDEATLRGPSTESAGTGYGLTTTRFSVDVYALHKDIPWQIKANEDMPLNSDSDATRFLTHKLMINAERRWASALFTTGVWSYDKVGTTDFVKWSNQATSDPIKDVDDAKAAVKKATGLQANVMAVQYEVHLQLKRHPLVVDRHKYTSGDSITRETLARLFEVEKYVILDSVYANNAEGATNTQAYIHRQSVGLFHVTKTPSIFVPSAMYSFAWTGYGNEMGIGIDAFDIRVKKSTRVEGETAFSFKKVAADCGAFLDSAI